MINEMEWGQVKRLVKQPPDLFLDIGVGIPYSEAWICRRDWPNAKIIGCEPCPTRYNQVSNIFPGKLYNFAVVDKPGLFRGSVNHYDFKVDAEEDKNDPYVPFEVEATTVDDIIKSHGPFESVFVWADCEGAEFVVIQGATENMKNGKIIGFNLEFWPKPPTNGWAKDQDIAKFLEEYGYIAPKEYLEWDRVYVTDFVFIHKDRL